MERMLTEVIWRVNVRAIHIDIKTRWFMAADQRFDGPNSRRRGGFLTLGMPQCLRERVCKVMKINDLDCQRSKG
jgi:hypothetical protein